MAGQAVFLKWLSTLEQKETDRSQAAKLLSMQLVFS